MNYPSVKTIETRLGIDRTKAKTVRQLMRGELAAVDAPIPNYRGR